MSGTLLTDGLILKIILKSFHCAEGHLMQGLSILSLEKVLFHIFFLLKFNNINSTLLPRRK